MTRKETVRICDVCNKRVTDEGEMHFGGHPHDGWFAVNQNGGGTSLRELGKKHGWDVCSITCLKLLAAKLAA